MTKKRKATDSCGQHQPVLPLPVPQQPAPAPVPRASREKIVGWCQRQLSILADWRAEHREWRFR